MNRKDELRGVVLDIISEREHVTYDPWQFGQLTAGVAEVLFKRCNSPDSGSPSVFQPERRLVEEDWLLVQEIFWDLVFERVITIGLNSSNPEYPWYRLHSEASQHLEVSKTRKK